MTLEHYENSRIIRY